MRYSALFVMYIVNARKMRAVGLPGYPRCTIYYYTYSIMGIRL